MFIFGEKFETWNFSNKKGHWSFQKKLGKLLQHTICSESVSVYIPCWKLVLAKFNSTCKAQLRRTRFDWLMFLSQEAIMWPSTDYSLHWHGSFRNLCKCLIPYSTCTSLQLWNSWEYMHTLNSVHIHTHLEDHMVLTTDMIITGCLPCNFAKQDQSFLVTTRCVITQALHGIWISCYH